MLCKGCLGKFAVVSKCSDAGRERQVLAKSPHCGQTKAKCIAHLYRLSMNSVCKAVSHAESVQALTYHTIADMCCTQLFHCRHIIRTARCYRSHMQLH